MGWGRNDRAEGPHMNLLSASLHPAIGAPPWGTLAAAFFFDNLRGLFRIRRPQFNEQRRLIRSFIYNKSAIGRLDKLVREGKVCSSVLWHNTIFSKTYVHGRSLPFLIGDQVPGMILRWQTDTKGDTSTHIISQ
ncbi:hypothetical protein DFQ01_102397 [Paenibacillus cellulosilyticus]|uniref:Uncharacterized protein n=1 Tax=Paenibacillus cellulosilyticus TaxID=375489 RepID=A0A2V2YZD9_9BACL|nr:hypothetical protein DFQ01_102397 [Paenibacillus cellulosilyticus]